MKNIPKLFLILFSLAMLPGCFHYYQVIRIPDTEAGLAAYRQCITAYHSKDVAPCLAGIPGVTSTGWVSGGSEYTVSSRCREIAQKSYFIDDDPYDLSIQACEESSMPPKAYQDAKGNWHYSQP